MIVPTFDPSVMACAAALVIGSMLGAWVTHEFYAPRLALAESRVTALVDSLEEQNTAVEKLEKSAKDRAAAAKKAVDAAKIEAEESFTQALSLLSTQPPPGVDRCTAASDLVRAELAK